ncbi:type III-B CRISPR module RAMP protein Cmr6 [Thiocapsa imhoffii]|uniref:Type III-B CRISPR module RAMP protein Cmr6 n=1 Tax=Thiocapsa imhoffii TaxID=382777 RepID=A0A9X0WI89_9GAMM|nr:type III-B CRISPR module RAMP protein Cmr6 [Thiocapsa imhoffii]MBK1645226.1 type III-B CRISPR module RAMP protein Cmr6 [Thiocapsa imhoffii]
MPIQLMREVLQPLYSAANDAHPGLLIQRGYPVYDADTEEGRRAKTAHLQEICAIPASPFYHNAYQRWQSATTDPLRFRQLELALETRLFIGLTGGGMLETGCAISHSYGMPYIPGSSVKGVVRAHARTSLFGHEHPEIIAELFGVDADPDPDQGWAQGLSGLVAFHDAWWVPGSADHPLVEEIVTTHHLDYYGSEGQTPATDFDSPVPNAQIAVQGRFLFVLEGPRSTPGWLDLAEKMLTAALSMRGIGAKTRTGYGLFDPVPKVPKGPVCAWVDDNIVRLLPKGAAADNEVLRRIKTGEVLRGKDLAEAWQKIGDASLKAEALADIQSRWEAEGWWESPPSKGARKVKKTYTGENDA